MIMEWKNGFRSDGMAMSIYSTIGVVLGGLTVGVLNIILSKTGYVQPFTATAETLPSVLQQIQELGYTMQIPAESLAPTMDGVYTIAVNQTAATNNALTFLYLGLDVFACLAGAALMLFFNVEKTISFKQKVIRERLRARAIADGIEWIEPEEKERLELLAAEEELTQNRLKEIEEHCRAKGLDVEAEKAKYLESVRLKKEQEAEKKREKEEKARLKLEKKLAAMTPEKRAKLEQRKAEREKKTLALWEKEAKANEAHFQKVQASLYE